MANDIKFSVEPADGFSIGGIPIDALLKDALSDIKDKMAAEARDQIPVETGELKATGIGEFGPTKIGPGRWVAGVGLKKDPFYGIFVHDGTGIYGPRKSRIYPRTAPYLKFTIDNRTFRVRSVAGQEAQPFMDRAFEIVNARYVPARVERLRLAIQAFANN